MPEGPPHRSIHDCKPIAVPKIGHWIGGAVLTIFAIVFLQVLVTNKNMQWGVVAEYMLNPAILSGLGMTLLLTFLAMVLGLAIGVVLAIMRLSGSRVFQTVSWGWIWFFRGVPPLVQMIFWYNLALLLPEISIGIPFGGPKLISWNTNELITPFSAAIMGLAFTESAYAAEMIRAGIQAVNVGQTEAAATLGMTRGQTLRRIVLPQALRIVIPPIGNDTISMLKFTSLVSVLALPDLLYSAQMVYARTYQTVPLLLVATIWYLALTTILTLVEHAVEQRLKSEHSAAANKNKGWILPFRLFARQQEAL
ncbi:MULTISPECIES: amino acid ABC transporter permease [unclassified Mesorhizobium]|uniref:amino acid ABC transporter permease n=1 Tax=unclassified Mesorhizobium TaxID=325217 RepID=UPI000FCAF73F|nr:MULTISPECIES: amino acid ABC transporter permease [unclassified Mesorhizobium]RUX34026.1 amino acid ABC transporter permease [Mesorhizobium sp. M2A.F.Ca.ET.042.01.1.1]RWD73624.1 MAG: amino acid ABC transporter permease [Mesorhizobium sp.]RWE79095.1 MAG: amino acid ABC transporter permease [Mesorhizobium sp.]TIV61513.1 MAG: ABC transporter permease subunit [Mesorhizobium sp.]TIW19383.1 MAG: ABC transporter permease subunit [Mesorhizobium sp.]